MGKKKKVDINGKPLQTITIGEIKKSKYGFLGVILLFVLFIGIVYFMPEITKLYNSYFKQISQNTSVLPVQNNTVREDDENVVDDNPYYSLDNKTTVEYENLMFNEIKYDGVNLTFSVLNNDDKEKNLNGIIFSLYEDEELAKSFELSGTIESKKSETFSFEISSEANYYFIDKIEVEENSDVGLLNNTLTCKKDNNLFTYIFEDNKLVSVSEECTLNKSDSSYESTYDFYDNIVNKYGSFNGISMALSMNSQGLKYNSKIDYTVYTSNISEQKFYFEKGMEAKNVKSELEEELFECS